MLGVGTKKTRSWIRAGFRYKRQDEEL